MSLDIIAVDAVAALAIDPSSETITIKFETSGLLTVAANFFYDVFFFSRSFHPFDRWRGVVFFL
jgi:hypothetical protein